MMGEYNCNVCVAQAMVWSAANGIGLALVIPCIASLVADYNPAETRGRAFGFMQLTSGLGMGNTQSYCSWSAIR
jgi:MFS family permease